MTMEAKLLGSDDILDADTGEAAGMDAVAILEMVLSSQQRLIELERVDAARTALALAASDLESIKANETYERAYFKAAKRLRERKDAFLLKR
ncbi:hypothetical protein FXB41_28765 [Bradyrhizobium canariense]|uniref:hypothetical protein n=1 Tax=Bradyrhizobium canariense TaxID=255045 RepID=UPI001CA4EB0D|nr:hypothetical protein [Bradyrhizobium canariense]MBW5438611.1 hypothetical protein [Bradyrhizobium canariense]